MKRPPTHDRPGPDPHGGRSARWLFAGVLGLALVMAFGCACGGLVFWMALGSPWPLDPSAFVE
jgi:hypothetical protein